MILVHSPMLGTTAHRMRWITSEEKATGWMVFTSCNTVGRDDPDKAKEEGGGEGEGSSAREAATMQEVLVQPCSEAGCSWRPCELASRSDAILAWSALLSRDRISVYSSPGWRVSRETSRGGGRGGRVMWCSSSSLRRGTAASKQKSSANRSWYSPRSRPTKLPSASFTAVHDPVRSWSCDETHMSARPVRGWTVWSALAAVPLSNGSYGPLRKCAQRTNAGQNGVRARLRARIALQIW